MRKFTLSLLAFSALTGAAAAADLAAQTTPPAFAPEFVNWTGSYGGAQAGGAFGSTDFNLPSAAYSSSWRNDGFAGGVHLGYNYQVNSLVFGVQGSFDFLSVEGNLSSSVPYAPKAFTAKSYHDWLASADGRLGYAFKNYLVYAIGGYAFLANNTALNVAGAQVAGLSNAINGYDIGAGVEYAINDKWSARLEYRYYNFATNTNSLLNSSKVFSESYNTSVVRAGVTYKFGAVEANVAPAK
jgi:outer membrane immunogenic protein